MLISAEKISKGRDVPNLARAVRIAPPDERGRVSTRVAHVLALLILLAAPDPHFPGSIVGVALAEIAAPGTADDSEAVDKTEAYVARLRTALPGSWFEQEFRRQRSFPALARSRRLAAAGKYEEAVEELERYLASDTDDLVLQLEYLKLATIVKRYPAAISAANKILDDIRNFAPALFYRGLARAALGENKDALPDLAVALASGELAPEDVRYAQRSLALIGLASPALQDAFALIDREAARPGADGALLVARGQLLERLARPGDAMVAFDEASKRTGNPDDRRAAWARGAELALKRGDVAGALSRSQSAWKLAPGNSEVAVVLAEAASRLGRTDLVETAERETKAAGTADRGTHEVFANVLYRLGLYDQAVARFDELAETAGSPAEEYRLRRAAGFAAQAAKDLPRALSELQRAAAINPEPEALSAAAEASLQAGRLDVAATDLRRLVDISEWQDRRHALERLSVVEEQMSRFEEARAALDQVPTDQRDAEVERRSAVLAAKAGNREAVVVYAVRLAGLQPTRPNLRALGEAQLAAGQTDAAVGSFERALKAGPEDDPSLREMLANTLAATEQPKRAALEFDALATKAKGPADEYRLRLAGGFAALKSGDSARALMAFRRAVEIEPTRKSLEAAAETALQAGQLAEAAGYLERLAASDRDLHLFASWLELRGEAPAATQGQDRDLLASVQHLERLSVVYEMMGRTRESAEALARLPEAAQSKPEIIRRQAVLAQRLGDRKALLAHMRDLVAAEPNEENFAALDDAQIGAGQSSAAAATLEALLANLSLPAEKRAGYLERLGNIEASRGNTKRAQALFAESFRLSPAHPPEWLAQAAESAMQANDGVQAVQYYRMLAGDERIPRKSRAGYAVRLGFALASLSRDREALAAYETAIQLGGATPSLHENRGAVLMRLGRAVAAASEFRAAYDAHPRPGLALSLGYAHQAAHQPGLAIVFLRRALADPQALPPEQRRRANAALGYAYSETGQYEQAAGCFENALGAARPRSTSSPSCAQEMKQQPSSELRLVNPMGIASATPRRGFGRWRRVAAYGRL